MADELLFVSSPENINGGFINAGAVYVFELEASGWVEQQTLLPADQEQGKRFGWKLAVDDGNVLLITAPGDNGGATGDGAVYVFTLDGTWNFELKLTESYLPGGFSGTNAIEIDSGSALIGSSSQAFAYSIREPVTPICSGDGSARLALAETWAMPARAASIHKARESCSTRRAARAWPPTTWFWSRAPSPYRPSGFFSPDPSSSGMVRGPCWVMACVAWAGTSFDSESVRATPVATRRGDRDSRPWGAGWRATRVDFRSRTAM